MIADQAKTTQSPHSPFARLVAGQTIDILDSFELESGVRLEQVPVAYKTWGRLNAEGTNALVLCHALSGSADVEDWWGPLLGPGRTFDTSRFFVFCGNVLGSPYGTASPCTINPATGKRYGPAFPQTTIRDDVRLHRTVLDRLGVKQVAFVIGGSMGGMQVLEWALLFGPEYVRHIAAIATSGRHSAWCISWGEAQRQAIYSDPKYLDGNYSYDDPPNTGLAAARMAALLTYRTRNSFESRFGRKVMPQVRPQSLALSAAEIQHNEGNKFRLHGGPGKNDGGDAEQRTAEQEKEDEARRAEFSVYSAQSYLRYQGDKFVSRFDANCYIAITRKLDSHDISVGRGDYTTALGRIAQKAIVIGIETDGLFTVDDQYELGAGMPNARVVIVASGEGHDGFLLELDRMRALLNDFIRECAPEAFTAAALPAAADAEAAAAAAAQAPRSSLFGEADDFLVW
ncbi:L-homoserine-O-acetyltransferase [Polyrhizophydium stewartii]|uniref:L-homoserine-O-acetyltransferase n=1 Tax=Polyrhizophydium stewartii TaxID=2732419 RepID=A0ABR4MWA2_9FUNG